MYQINLENIILEQAKIMKNNLISKSKLNYKGNKNF